jgi:hypothetical protein
LDNRYNDMHFTLVNLFVQYLLVVKVGVKSQHCHIFKNEGSTTLLDVVFEHKILACVSDEYKLFTKPVDVKKT